MSHPSGDAIAATEHVVNAVARAMAEVDSGPQGSTLFSMHWREFGHGYRVSAITAISAYERAMKEIAKP